MSDRLLPSPEAKARVQACSQRELQAFFDEIPAPALRALASYLPSVDGFRRGSPAGIAKQKEVLARRLSRPTANEKDYNALYMLWRTWIDETQQNAPLVQALIDELEEAAHKAEGPEERTHVINRHTDSLLEKLKEESEQNRSTRECIERLFTFSPLPETANARAIMAAAKPAVDVAHDAAYRNLPTRLDRDEREIDSIKTTQKVLTDRLETIVDECAKIRRDLPGIRDSIREARSVSDATHADLNEQINRLRRDYAESVRTSNDSRITSTTAAVGQLTERARLLDAFQAKLSMEQAEQARRIAEVITGLELLRKDVDALLSDGAQDHRISTLADQIAHLTHRVDELRSTSQNGAPQPFVSGGSALHCTSISTTGDPSPISSHVELATSLADALLPLGLRKSAAQLLGEECAAAVSARQAVFLEGAFASRVAQALALAIGGSASARLAMPIGILDGTLLRIAIDEAFASLTNRVGGLAIEAVNHVPFDVIGEVLTDCVDPVAPAGTVNRRIAIFATISRGVASIPAESELFEVGPIFRLDYLDWRTSPHPAPPPRGTFLPAKTDEAIFAQAASSSANVEEAVHLARALAAKRSPAVDRAVVRAYQALHLIRQNPEAVSPLHSLFFGWLLPYWGALGLSAAQIDSEFDGGKVPGAPLDERLTAMFNAEFLPRNKS